MYNNSDNELHKTLWGYYLSEIDIQRENRKEMETDYEYYHNKQYSDEEAAVIKSRGQQASVYNIVATSVDWVLGNEKRKRTDFKILPREQEDSKSAEVKTKYLKYLSDTNRTQFHRSRAFADAVIVGVGWLEVGVQDEDDGEPIFERYESWRNMIWDSSSMEIDSSDMRYIFRSKWVDEDIAIALYPNQAELIRDSVEDVLSSMSDYRAGGDPSMDNDEANRRNPTTFSAQQDRGYRPRLKLIEASYRTPEKVNRIKGGPRSGEIFDENDPVHQESVSMGAGIVPSIMMRTRVAIMTRSGIIYDGPSPYRHNRHKFVPVWGHRGAGGHPYGLIRRVRDPQDALNKKISKALFIMATNKVIMDRGAVQDIEQLRREIALPTSIIEKTPGMSLVIDADRELAQSYMALVANDMSFIQQSSGVTDELLGRETNAQSGIAVQRRQEQGSLATSLFFDNLRMAEQIRGELLLSLVEQYVTEKKVFRITNMDGGNTFQVINDGLPENDITRTKADFIVSDQDMQATARQAAANSLMELIAKLPPEMGTAMLDLVVENLDIPNGEELSKRIRAINGQKDPNQQEPTPEDQAQMAQAQQMQQMQMQRMELDLRGQQASVAKLEADAKKSVASGMLEAMKAAQAAVEAGRFIADTPTAAKAGDALMRAVQEAADNG